MRIGLISDTHMPERWKQIPATVFKLFDGVDVILHAGDVGQLWVLDELSRIAPVVAVHGNDETAEATAALPYLQTIVAAGHRIVLTHAHYPDRAEELASRTEAWEPTLQRRSAFAREHGAEIIVYGHLHIPMNLHYENILMVNPGGVASGNAWTKQVIQTVAVMRLETGQAPQVTHYDLNTMEIHEPKFDAAGFAATERHYSRLIVEADLFAQREWLWKELRPLAPEGVWAAILGLAHECWDGKRESFSARDVVEALRAANLPVEDKLRENPVLRQYL
ncbi:MAG TPA: metallophosphoesterase family protein [Aggregatilineaceae bacterium]|nr:metallophosphoesterase family protein [Aggregatilineaceae bacterium]